MFETSTKWEMHIRINQISQIGQTNYFSKI